MLLTSGRALFSNSSCRVILQKRSLYSKPSVSIPSYIKMIGTRHLSGLNEDKKDEKIKILDEKEAEEPGWRDKAARFAKDYGKVGILTHTVLSICSFSTIYTAVNHGVDVGSLLSSIGFSIATTDKTSTAGTFMISYSIYKLLSPVRWPITFAVTPLVIKVARKKGLMPKKAVSNNPIDK